MEGGGEEGRFGGESGKFCPFPQDPERRGGGIVEGISAANKMIQREELAESTLPEKRATAERAAARQCLPPGEGELPAAASASPQPSGSGKDARRVRARGWRRMRSWERLGGTAAARRSQPRSPLARRLLPPAGRSGGGAAPFARRSEELPSVLFGGAAC